MNKVLTTIRFYLLYSLYFVLSLLPLRVLYVFSDILYYILYHVARYRRKIVHENLVLSFPEKSPEEIIRIEKKFFSNLCDYFFDTIKMTTMSRKQVMRRMKFEGHEYIEKLAEEGKSSVVYLSHTFNWEWISSLPLNFENKETILGQVYHKLSNRAFDRLFLKIRGRYGSTSIPMADVFRKMIGYRKEQRRFVLGLIADQAPRRDHVDYWINFLHQDTAVISGTERIIKKTNSAAFYGNVTCIRRGYYVCKMELMSENTADVPDFELTDLYFKRLEEDIRRTPELWLWSHKRWKYKKENFK